MSHPYDRNGSCSCPRCARERKRREAQAVQSRLRRGTPEQALYRAVFGDGVNVRRQRRALRERNADRIDGYDRDDLGESPDY